MTTLSSSVGRRDNGTAVQSFPSDQSKIIDLLDRITPTDGGQRSVWARPAAGTAYQPPALLVAAIKTFQLRWLPTGEVKKADGVVDPSGATLKQLDAKATAMPVGPGGTDPTATGDLTITQVNKEAGAPYLDSMTVLGPVIPGQPVISVPVAAGYFLFLFKVEKDGHRYWVGVAAPPLTTDFSRVQVFLHATPGQAGVRAQDYHDFKADWRDRMFNYVTRGGTQLAAIRPMLLIVPFMIDAATKKDSPANVFATRSQATLNAIVNATHQELAKRIPIVPPATPHKVTKLGVTSFSSGISFMRAFIGQFGDSGIIAETIDLDSRYIISERTKPWVRASGAKASWIAQWAPPPPAPRQPVVYPPAPPGFVFVSATKLVRLVDIGEDAHHTLGFYGYYQAMLKSVLV